MRIFFKNETQKNKREVVNAFLSYIGRINDGYYVKEAYGYDQKITSSKIRDQAMYLAKQDKKPLLDPNFLAFLYNIDNYRFSTRSHTSFYVSFGYCYEVDYKIDYYYDAEVENGYKIRQSSFSQKEYYLDKEYKNELVNDSYNETRNHNAVGVVQIDEWGRFIKGCKNDECDELEYWPVSPNRSPFFNGTFKETTLEEITKSTFYNKIVMPSNENITNYIESYCDSYSLHSGAISHDEVVLEDEFHKKIRGYTRFRSCDYQNLKITKSKLTDTFSYIVENYYTYEISYTYNGLKYTYPANNIPSLFSSLSNIHLIYSNEINKYKALAEVELRKQAEESKERIKLNKEKTDEVASTFSRRNKTHLIITLILSFLYVLSFIGTFIYRHFNPSLDFPLMSFPISLNQLGVALLLLIAYIAYYRHKGNFNSYRNSDNKDWNGRIQVIEKYQILNAKKADKKFQIALIILYSLASIYLTVLILAWIVSFMAH